jgi:ABC-type bacteriocin/lantibiotic exporter with double-glycine peptidase domain
MFSTPLSGTSISLNQSVLASREQRQYDWLAQRDANDCGPASLTMAARGLGLDTTLEHVRALVKLGPAGSNLQDLAEAAGRLGLRATAVRIAPTQLASVRLPAVAHLANGHYIALFDLRLDGLVAGDPASGVRTLPFPAFQQAWSGNLLLLARADA